MLAVFDAYLFMLGESLAIIELVFAFCYIAYEFVGDSKSFGHIDLTKSKEI